MLFELIALCAACLLAGILLGLGIAHHRERRFDAPAPVLDMGYDPTNPINRKHADDIYTQNGLEDVRQWRIC